MKPTRRVALAFAILLTGCVVGPNYRRPQIDSQPQFPGSPGSTLPTAESLADPRWFDVFEDDVLRKLIQVALERNFDLRIASERILEARAQLGIRRAILFPEVDDAGTFTALRASLVGPNRFALPGASLDSSFTQAGFSLSWELDVWGRLRRLTEAARAQYLATEAAR
jgi:multidrug efflux system outer membrane protein